MSEKNSQQLLRNDKKEKHRKLIRSPEKLSPCDTDAVFNPSFLSTATNIFAAPSTTVRSSPTKHFNDQFPPQQAVWPSGNLPPAVDHSSASNSPFSSYTSLPPSTSTPSIALYRKPSITIKYSSKDDDGRPPDATALHSSLSYHQRISKSIDSNSISATTEPADQSSNNFLINVNSVPECCLHRSASVSPSKKPPPPPPKSPLTGVNGHNSRSSTTARDIYPQQQTTALFAHSPTSQSLNLNLMNQSSDYNGFKGPFNSNNPFLNDNFDEITVHEDEGGGKIDAGFFNIDDKTESELLYLGEDTPAKQTCDVMEERLLKNKREKFSNASTMKICLVVSPPTNKLFHVSAMARKVRPTIVA